MPISNTSQKAAIVMQASCEAQKVAVENRLQFCCHFPSHLLFTASYYCNEATEGGHKLICGSPRFVPVSHLDYFSLTQIHGNTCAQVPELWVKYL
jgi:hypothetical protein